VPGPKNVAMAGGTSKHDGPKKLPKTPTRDSDVAKATATYKQTLDASGRDRFITARTRLKSSFNR